MSLCTRMWIRVAILVVALPLSLRAQFYQPIVDDTAADRGGQLFAQSCSSCHGADARGTAKGVDLLRSLVVLHDRMQNLKGTEMEAVLKAPPDHNFDLTQPQVADLSQFLVREVDRSLRSGYSNEPTNLLSGDAKAGEAFFNGAGGCTKCHSPTGDLAGVAKRFTPAALQGRWVFPNSAGRGGRGGPTGPPIKKAQVTVTSASGQSVTGDLIRVDDFNVTLREASGQYHTWTRVPGLKVQVVDPYATHIALLDKYTDADIHNMTTYLETLK
jgi:cytochrome c oxidase cbb3-type subunit III